LNNLRNLAIWIVLALLLVFLFNLVQGTAQHASAQNITYTKFVDEVNQGQVKAVTMQGDAIKGELGNGQPFTTMAPASDTSLVPMMKSHNVNISVSPPDDGFNLMAVILNALPMLLLIAVWIFFMRQLQAGGGKAMGFGKSRAKMLTERTGRVTFVDVAGVDIAHELGERDRLVRARLGRPYHLP
jgi:cell division protease FtsH